MLDQELAQDTNGHEAVAPNGANLDELRILRIRVPLKLLVNLQYCKIMQSRDISDLVSEALTAYFANSDAWCLATRATKTARPGAGVANFGAAAITQPAPDAPADASA